ncbi:MAG: hypothetical protein U9N62_00155 [Thermotogota bacterium]|nr:hypothetical protein [Thermotogota bacterium]
MTRISCIILIFFLVSLTCLFAFELEASTTNSGVVKLYEDGTWEWIIQPPEYIGFNYPESDLNPASEVETVPFDFKDFSSFPVNYIGKWTWIMGEVFMILEEEEGEILRIKTRKNIESWIQQYGDILVVFYDGPTLNEGDKLEILVEYRGVGYKYYSSVPVFHYKEKSQVRFLE